MEKYIYRLALVTRSEVDIMFPHYFANKEAALRYVEIFVSVNNESWKDALTKYSNTEQGNCCNSCILKEARQSFIYNFELLYKDNTVQHERYLAITKVVVYE